ncbi:response regulator [Owenweeksia hongkongensis]|uniref:response regulator n=1 Tax=Owenweeksia hongkongensis TaxID=253245 RepID=UPI003A91D030
MIKKKKGNHRFYRSVDIAVSIAVGLVLSILVAYIWQLYSKDIREARSNKMEVTGQFISDQFQHVIEDNTQLLNNLKQRIEVTDGDYLKYWKFDAQLMISQNPSFQLVEWIDSNMVIRDVEPVEGNEAVIDLDISNIPYRRDAWIKSSLDSSINVTKWANLTQGGNSFLVDAPVYYDGTFQGTITAGMVFNNHFDAVMAGREEYSLVLYDDKGTLFYSVGDTNLFPQAENFIFESKVPVKLGADQLWTLKLKPTKSFFGFNTWFESNLGFILGLIIALMMGITLFLLLQSSREKRRVSHINRELKKLNSALSKEKHRAEEASVAKSEFLSNMSHEIRTPLNAILGFIDILNRKKLEDESMKYLRMMTFSSKNLLALVNDVLEIDRIESGKVELLARDFNPLEEVRLLLDLYEQSFEEKGLNLTLETKVEQGKVALGDSLKFNQVLTNLLRNSFKFTQIGGVKLKYTEEVVGGNLNIKIVLEDTGIGIPAANLDKIFDRFSQVETGYTRKYEGTGLGLAITKKLIDAMGGSISVSSIENQGTEFSVTFVFPLGDSDFGQGAEKEEEAASYLGKEILIAEDNPMNVLVLSKLLEQFGVMADVASDGLEALQKLETKSYDLIFMDLHMPEMDGLEATRKIRDKGLNLPIVALSANITKKSREESKSSGMQDYITKPFTREVILRILSKYLS